jgi:hypothetical protein
VFQISKQSNEDVCEMDVFVRFNAECTIHIGKHEKSNLHVKGQAY